MSEKTQLNKLERLKEWLNREIEFHQRMGDESLEIEEYAGSLKYVSTGHYQRVVALKQVLAFISKEES